SAATTASRASSPRANRSSARLCGESIENGCIQSPVMLFTSLVASLVMSLVTNLARRTHSTIAANKGRDFAPASFPGAANGLFYDLTSVGKAGATHDSLGAHFNRFGDRRLIDERHRTGTGKKRSTR